MGKFAQEQFLVSEEDYPYRAVTGKCKHPDAASLGKVYSVDSYNYIGGAYGYSNERTIMEEIYNNGPVVVNFEPR